ncbi:MAG: hypothetical protein IT236_05015, partial [Bacteroidia bacterium]|nr:hypothetical protein [Bacteroidia bacterium]
MANLKLKYELSYSGQGNIELLIFDYCKPDLAEDQQDDNPKLYKNKKPCEVTTFEPYIEVIVLADSNDPLFVWELKIKRVDDHGNELYNLTP